MNAKQKAPCGRGPSTKQVDGVCSARNFRSTSKVAKMRDITKTSECVLLGGAL